MHFLEQQAFAVSEPGTWLRLREKAAVMRKLDTIVDASGGETVSE